MRNKWICLNCKAINDSSKHTCNKCNKIKLFNGEDVYKVENGSQSTYVRSPTIMGRDVVFLSKSRFADTKCTACNKIICAGDDACIHCHHFFTPEEKNRLTPINKFSGNFYLKSALVWVVIFTLLVLLLD